MRSPASSRNSGVDWEAGSKKLMTAEQQLKKNYLRKAISEYEYSPAPEYEKTRMTVRAMEQGTIDFNYGDAESDVEVAPDGAWVKSRVWVPKEWMESPTES